MRILARRPNPLQFAEWNQLPLLLGGAASRGAAAIGDSEVLAIAGRMRDLLVWCCLDPRVATGETAGDGEILPRDIPEADWTFIVAWAMRLKEAEALSTFRGQSRHGDRSDDGGAVFVETERAAGDRGPGAGADGGRGSGETAVAGGSGQRDE
jgi:hypothetical protein